MRTVLITLLVFLFCAVNAQKAIRTQTWSDEKKPVKTIVLDPIVSIEHQNFTKQQKESLVFLNQG